MKYGKHIGFTEIPGNALVQFDYGGLGSLETCIVCHGWHEFPEEHFEIDKDEN